MSADFIISGRSPRAEGLRVPAGLTMWYRWPLWTNNSNVAACNVQMIASERYPYYHIHPIVPGSLLVGWLVGW